MKGTGKQLWCRNKIFPHVFLCNSLVNLSLHEPASILFEFEIKSYHCDVACTLRKFSLFPQDNRYVSYTPLHNAIFIIIHTAK